MAQTGRTRFGAWANIGSPIAVEQLSRQGFDYVCLDAQHGLFDFGTLRESLIAVTAAAGPAPFVRVGANDAAEIGRVLDAGAVGVIVPLIETVDDARAAAAAARYPVSGGRRSWGPVRTGAHFEGSLAEIDASITVLAMIETRSALADAEAILDVAGIDGVYIGPYDLSLALGADAPFEERILPELENALERVREAAIARGKIAGVHCGSGEAGAQRVAQGFDLVTVATDLTAMRAGVRADLLRARGEQ